MVSDVWSTWHSYPLAVCPSCKQTEGIMQCDSDYFFSCRRCNSGSMSGASFKTEEERKTFLKQKKLHRNHCGRYYPIKGKGELDHKEW